MLIPNSQNVMSNISGPFAKSLKKDETYVAFLSGPLIAKKEVAGKLIEFLSKTHQVAHLVLAGNTYSNSLSKLAKADCLFAAITKFVSIDLLPGYKDINLVSFPVQKPTPLLFPECQRINLSESFSFQGVNSPYFAQFQNSLTVLGHAGEPVDDLLRNMDLTNEETSFFALTASLEAGHLAPTSPDTLPCPGLGGGDPLIIKSRPDVFFCGGREKFGMRKLRDQGSETVLLLIPDLRRSPILVCVNMRDKHDVVVVNLGK